VLTDPALALCKICDEWDYNVLALIGLDAIVQRNNPHHEPDREQTNGSNSGEQRQDKTQNAAKNYEEYPEPAI
jgi:hypothetical protein